MRRLLACMLLLCALAGVAAAEDFGQSYDLFLTMYAENVEFLNFNTGRFLLPLTFSGSFNAEGERIYVLESGALSAEIKLDDLASQIASCRIVLTAPAGMKYGDSQHNDFTISGYQSYALLMAMHPSEDVYQRYLLVEKINSGLAANAGAYQTQAGDYRVTCSSENGSATMLFENALLLGESSEEEEPAEEDAPVIEIRE